MVETLTKPITQEKLPHEATLRELHIMPHGNSVSSLTRILDTRGGEGWIYGYQLDSIDSTGNNQTTYFREKHIISMAGDLAYKAQSHFRRMREAESFGIPTLKGYGVRGATVYEEFIPRDATQFAIGKINAAESDPEGQHYLDQLISIAAKLDAHGYSPLSFHREFIFDGDRKLFLLMDAGSDLGPSGKEPTTKAFSTLSSTFSKHAEYISRGYNEAKESLTETIIFPAAD